VRLDWNLELYDEFTVYAADLMKHATANSKSRPLLEPPNVEVHCCWMVDIFAAVHSLQ